MLLRNHFGSSEQRLVEKCVKLMPTQREQIATLNAVSTLLKQLDADLRVGKFTIRNWPTDCYLISQGDGCIVADLQVITNREPELTLAASTCIAAR